MKLFSILFAVAFVVGAMGAAKSPPETADNVVVLTESNTITLNAPVTDGSVAELMQELADKISKRGSSSYMLYIVLDTPGGSVQAGYRLYEFLKPYKNIATITLNSYSMGAILSQLNPGPRLMVETGTLMFHRMKTSMPPSTTDDIAAQIRYAQSLERLAEQKIAERSGIPQTELHERIDHEWYMGGAEALERNLMDKIIVVKCSKELLAEKSVKLVEIMPLLPPVEVVKSKCPLLN